MAQPSLSDQIKQSDLKILNLRDGPDDSLDMTAGRKEIQLAICFS